MITERDPAMKEISVLALGVEERSDEAPGPAARDRPRTRRSWPNRSGASSPQSTGCGSLRRRIGVRSVARWGILLWRYWGSFTSVVTGWIADPNVLRNLPANA